MTNNNATVIRPTLVTGDTSSVLVAPDHEDDSSQEISGLYAVEEATAATATGCNFNLIWQTVFPFSRIRNRVLYFAKDFDSEPEMMSIRPFILFLFAITGLRRGEAVVLEALIQVDSDNIQITSFLERFKKFIAQSHVSPSTAINIENGTGVEKYIHHNDSFQANYDFSENLLTIRSSYNLLHNKTGEKISDVKISINFRFDQDPNKKIIIEDFHGQDEQPRIGIDNMTSFKGQSTEPEEDNKEKYQQSNTIVGTILSPIVNTMELIIVTFFHIIVNGILGHVLTTAFEELYYGRLLSH